MKKIAMKISMIMIITILVLSLGLIGIGCKKTSEVAEQETETVDKTVEETKETDKEVEATSEEKEEAKELQAARKTEQASGGSASASADGHRTKPSAKLNLSGAYPHLRRRRFLRR